MGLHDAYRLARLHEQGLVLLEVGEGADDGVEARPVARRLAGAAVDDELVGMLGDIGVEVVLQHAQGGLGLPVLGGERGADGGAHGAGSGHGAIPPLRCLFRQTVRWFTVSDTRFIGWREDGRDGKCAGRDSHAHRAPGARIRSVTAHSREPGP